jgi:hypothetical protein
VTFTGRRGDPSVVSWDGQRIDLFARGADDALLHWWEEADGETGVESLGGTLAGDPVAVTSGMRRLDVFAHGAGGWLLHWWWDDDWGGMLGPETWTEGRVVYDPIAVGHGNVIDGDARSATNDLLQWSLRDGVTPDPSAFGGTVTTGVAALFRDRVPDVFAGGQQGGLTHWGFVHVVGSAQDRMGWEELGGSLVGSPAVASWGWRRIDVVARGADGRLQHWGWAGDQRFYDSAGVWHTGRWFGPDLNLPGRCDGDPSMVAVGGGQGETGSSCSAAHRTDSCCSGPGTARMAGRRSSSGTVRSRSGGSAPTPRPCSTAGASRSTPGTLMAAR